MRRRELLAGSAAWVAAGLSSQAETIRGGNGSPWRPYAGEPPKPVDPAG